MDLYQVTTPPVETPVSLDDAKLFLRTYSDIGALEDGLITSLIQSVVTAGEDQYTSKCFVTRGITAQAKASSVKTDIYIGKQYLEINRAPNVVISSVESLQSGVYTDISSDTELIQTTTGFPRLYFTSTPAYDSDTIYPFRVIFTAGYGLAAVVPHVIKTAVLQHVNFLYENRADAISQISPLGEVSVPFQTLNLYSSVRTVTVFSA